MKKIFVSLTLILLISCAKNTEPKKVKVSFGSLKNLPATLTDIMIIGKNDVTGDYFGFAYDELFENSIDLETGLWSFAAFGWDGQVLAADTFNGNLRCGSTDGHDITVDTTIDLSITQLGCADTLWGPTGIQRTNGMPDPITLHHCLGWESSSDPASCNVSDTPQSYLLTINGFYTNPFILPGNSLGSLSRCVNNVKNLVTGFNTGVKLPLFETIEAPVPMTIVAHSDTNCVTATGSFSFNGIGSNIHTAHSRNDLVFTNDLSQICTWGANNTPFAQGAYTSSGINYICTEAQLLAISGVPATHFAGDFKLMADLNLGNIDMRPFMIGGGGLAQYTGTFDGNGHTISNYKIIAISSGGEGLFGDVRSGGIVQNLNVADVTITSSVSSRFLGAVVGNCQNAGELKNISATNVTIDSPGGNTCGGVVGVVNNSCPLSNLTATNITINNTNGFNIGGVVGDFNVAGNKAIEYLTANNINITSSANTVGGVAGNAYANVNATVAHIFSTDVTLTQTSGSVSNYGGVFGHMRALGAGEFRDFASTNTVINVAQANSVGGVLGNFLTNPATASFKNFSAKNYTITDTNATAQSLDYGGVIGLLSGVGVTVDYIKAQGSISAANTQNVGGLIGRATGSGGVNIQYTGANTTISCTTAPCSVMGGAIGVQDGGAITHNFNYSKVSGSVSGTDNIGGVIGYSASGGSRFMAYVGTDVDVTSTGNQAGGFVGCSYSTISDSYTSGTVTGVDKVGGMTGQQNAGNITKSIASGVVTASTNFAAVHGETLGGTACPASCYVLDTNTEAGTGVGSGSSVTQKTAAFMNNTANHNATGFPNLVFTAGVGPWRAAATPRLPLPAHEFLNETFGDFHAGGAGDPWPVTTTAHWNALNEYGSLHNDISIKLNANIDFNGVTFVPIGSNSLAFTGELYGNNKTMSNIDMTVNNSTNGIIDWGDGVEVTDLNIVGMTISIGGNNESAALMGFGSGSGTNIFKNITVDSTTTIDGGTNMGGVFGEILNTGAGSVYENIVSNATVTGTNKIGGIFGTFRPDATATVTNVTNNGTITGGGNAGGIAGQVSGSGVITISDSSNTGAVTGAGSATSIGGFIANEINGNITITRCFNSGTVSDSGILTNAGGFIGYTVSTITDSYNIGSLNLNNTATGGGFIGNNAGTITRSYNSGANSGASTMDGFAKSNTGTTTGNVSLLSVDAIPTGATAVSDTNMRLQATYVTATVGANWDFTTIWTTNGDTTFPVHQ